MNSCMLCKLNNILFILSIILTTNTACANKISIVTELLEPYQMRDNNGRLTGYSIEVMQFLLSRTNTAAPIQIKSWANAYKMALEQNNTLIFSIARSHSREDKFIWGGALLQEKLYVWGLREHSPNTVESLEALKQFKITVIRRGTQEEFLRENLFTNLMQTSNYVNTIKLLYGKRTQFIISAQDNLIERTKLLNLDPNRLFKVMYLEGASTQLYYAFSKNTDPDIVSSFQLAYKELVNSGKLAAIKDKWNIQ